MRLAITPILLSTALAVAAAIPTAHAAAVSGTFTGVMLGGSLDTANHFGGGDLGGQAITGTFSYDSTALNANNCPLVATEGCFFGQVSVTATIAGNTVAFPSAPAGNSLYGIVQYGGLTAAGTDQFTFSSFTGAFPSLGTISVTLTSSSSNFIPDPLDTTNGFTLAAADIGGSSEGTLVLPGAGDTSETLLFAFNSPDSGASRSVTGSGSDVPEPASLLLLGSGLAATMIARRRAERRGHRPA